MRDYSYDRFEYDGLLEFLNDPDGQPPEMHVKLIGLANRLLTERPLKRDFILHFRGQVQKILDASRVRVAIPANIVIGKQRAGKISVSRALRARSPWLLFDPAYADHFYRLACLVSDAELVQRFSKCADCGCFFIQTRKLQKGRCFCSPTCRFRFHAAQPAHKKANRESVALHRFYKRLADFITQCSSMSWNDKMMLWNSEGLGHSKGKRFSDIQFFKLACKEAARRNPK